MAPRVYAQFRVETRLVSQSYAEAVLTDSPVAYWRLGEASGLLLADASGNAHTIALASATGVTFGTAGAPADGDDSLAFDGTTAYLGTMTPIASSTTFSIEFWIRPNGDAAQHYQTIMIGPSPGFIGLYKMDSTAGGGGANRLNYFYAGDHYNTTPLVTGTLYHVVLSVSAGAGTWYLNGVADGTLSSVPTANWQKLFCLSAIEGPDTLKASLFDELALYPTALTPAQITNHYMLALTAWTDLTRDVLTETGIHWVRGTSGHGPLDRVADPGRLEFSLRNDKANTGKTRSWYSPNHPSARAGWTQGIAVRVVGRYNAVDYPLWRGKIVTIDPTPGDAPQRVAVVAQDSIADFTDAKVRTIPPQIDQTEVALLRAVLGALSPEDQPVAVDCDAPLDSFGFAFGDAGAGATALGLINDVVLSAFGTLFVAGDGTLTTINRHSEATAESVLTLVDEDLLERGPGFVGASSLQNVFKLVRVTIHPNHNASTILFLSTSVITLGPGESVDVWDTYSNPNDRTSLIAAKSFTALAATTDYTANAFADGSGTGADNLTSSLTISIETFTTTSLTHLRNPTTRTMYVTSRQLRGVGVFDDDPQTLESSVSSPGKQLDVDLKFQTDPVVAQTLADYLVAQYSDRTRHGEELVFDPHRSPTLMLAALSTEIGSVVTASERQTGLDEVDLILRGIAGDIEPGPYGFALTVRYSVVPQIASTAFIFDDPVFGVFDSPDAVLGYF